MIKALNDLGAVCYSTRGTGTAPIVVHGVLKGGNISINGGISSQFISSLLISARSPGHETNIQIEGDLKSKPYVEVTMEMLEKAGGHIATNFQEFEIPADQEYNLGNYHIPGDFSSASYMLAAGALAGKVTVENMFPSKQGDSAILEHLLDMGANVYWDQAKGSVPWKSPILKASR